ncbi:hypothetical protein PLUTE_a3752 [Pseudoalteromonas luteoviolacea DSM 6061]|nr:hypothetical protein [Pseudoalteromonas luteoviolacea DSM 6061]
MFAVGAALTFHISIPNTKDLTFAKPGFFHSFLNSFVLINNA